LPALPLIGDDRAEGPDGAGLPAFPVSGVRRYNERTSTALNRIQVPTDIVLLVVFWRLRYKLSADSDFIRPGIPM
jgi:hypothetical protein